jgi:acetyl-CoA carboxylase carboxyl transferase subunit beta
MKEFFRRTKISFTSGRKNDDTQIPDNMWVKCQECREIIYQKELYDNLQVCPKCGHHNRLNAQERLGMILDTDSFTEFDANLAPVDPLDFVSLEERYADKLSKTQEKTGLNDVVLSGVGTIEGKQLVLAICDFRFMGASMGSVYGEKMTRAAERATDLGVPLLTINSSGGARMQEGVIALMQMAKISMALTRLAHLRLPHIALLVDPCYGGVTASYVSVADVMIAEPAASIGFAGKRVIEQTIRQKLPADFQTAEFMLQQGMIDMVVPRSELRTVLGRLLRLHAHPATANNDQHNVSLPQWTISAEQARNETRNESEAEAVEAAMVVGDSVG